MERQDNRDPVIVVGGGLAGLTAAARLSAGGLPVLLLEQRPALGGRASSFTDTVTGDSVDNGQHLLIAGYTRTLAFAESIGSRHLLRIQQRPTLTFFHPRKGFVEFRLAALPAPMHLVWGIFTSSLFTPAERFFVLRAGLDIWRRPGAKKRPRDGKTILQWLEQCRQPESVRTSFWTPLALSIMNERIETASAATFLDALHTAFLRHWHDAALVFPEAGLSQIFAEPARQAIVAHGGVVRCNADVRELVREGEILTGVRLRDGKDIPCRSVLLAVPHARAMELYPPGMRRPHGLEADIPMAVSPIVSIHLWFATDFMDREMVGLMGKTVQWIFRKKTHISLVISAAHGLVDLPQEALVRVALEELRDVFGNSVGTPRHVLVIREKRATVSLTPETEQRRPGSETSITNLFLAGDWTDTGLPATIEGAIQSGETAAEKVLRDV